MREEGEEEAEVGVFPLWKGRDQPENQLREHRTYRTIDHGGNTGGGEGQAGSVELGRWALRPLEGIPRPEDEAVQPNMDKKPE